MLIYCRHTQHCPNYFYTYLSIDKENEISETCSMHEGRGCLGSQGIYGKLILKNIRCEWTGLSGQGKDSGLGSYKHGNDPSGSIKYRNFLGSRVTV